MVVQKSCADVRVAKMARERVERSILTDSAAIERGKVSLRDCTGALLYTMHSCMMVICKLIDSA